MTAGAEERSTVQVEAESEAVGFTGLWSSTYGGMRLAVGDDEEVRGSYTMEGQDATIEGELEEDGRLVFRYEEPTVAGEGWFQLSEDGKKFQGKWREDGADDWRVWEGVRMGASTNRRWLVVIEARWEQGLQDKEFEFGEMLETFFDRLPHVEVRHRTFANEEAFTRWCGEVAYLAEPVVVVVASHGTEEGVTVGGETIDLTSVGAALSDATNVELLHFSACQVMKGSGPTEIRRGLEAGSDFPISGYTTSVDWGASALIDFAYLEMILTGMEPAVAAEQVVELMPFAGDKKVKNTRFRAAGFRFSAPEKE